MTDCMLYAGNLDKCGYGRISQWYQHTQLSHCIHRIIYENNFGEVPKGKEIDHICRNRCCINIDHLRAVSHKENMQNQPKHRNGGYCAKKLHILSDDNLIKWVDKTGRKHWKCKTCHGFYIDKYNKNKKLEMFI